MMRWKNFQPDDFEDPNDVPSLVDGHKRKTPDLEALDARKRFRLHDERDSADDQAATRRPSERRKSISNTNEVHRENEEGRRDDILQLQAQIALLKELNDLKDERIQERAVKSKIEQVKWQEEHAQLTEDNSALRKEVLTLNQGILRLEHEVADLQIANEELFKSASSSHKLLVSEGIQTVSLEAQREQHLKENEMLQSENEDLRKTSQIYLEENTTLIGDVDRLHIMIKTKDDVINTRKKMGESWEQERSDMKNDADALQRQSEDELRRLKDENQRLLRAGASNATVVLDQEPLPLSNSGVVIPNQILNDQPDRDAIATQPMHSVATSLEPKEASRSVSESDSRLTLRDLISPNPFYNAPPDKIICDSRSAETTSQAPPPPPPETNEPPSATSAQSISGATVASVESILEAPNSALDELLPTAPERDTDDTSWAPLKRKRGRPKGSKNKCGTVASRAALNPTPDIPKRKPGRPRKEKMPQGLVVSCEPAVKRKRGPPKIRKSGDGSSTLIHQDDLPSTQGDAVIQSNSTNEERPASSSSIAPLNVSREGSPEVVLTPNNTTKEQPPLPVSGSVYSGEASTSSTQDLQDETEAEPRKPDSGGMIKLEPEENLAGLSQDHLELIYRLENGKLFCGLCARTQVTPPVFHVGISHQTLIAHCNIEHSHECTRLASMSPEKLTEMRNRMLTGHLDRR